MYSVRLVLTKDDTMVRESERKDWYCIVDNEGIIVDEKLYDNVNAALTEIKRLGELRC